MFQVNDGVVLSDADDVRFGGAADRFRNAERFILKRQSSAAGLGTDDFLSIDDEHGLARVPQCPRALQSRGAHTDDHDIEVILHWGTV